MNRWLRQRFAPSLVALLFIAGLSLSAAEPGTAVIPYENLDQAWETASIVNQTNLIFRVLIASTNAAVKPADIRLAIHSKVRGDIPVELNTNGELQAFTHTKELAKENPPIISNQPKGSMSLVIMGKIPNPDGLSFPYAKLRNGAAELNKILKAKAGLLSVFVPKATGVIFKFPTTSAGKARVEIRSAKGNSVFTADPQGEVRLKLDPRIPDSTEVRISEPVLALLPDIE